MKCLKIYDEIAGLVQDCSNSSANAMELLQARTEPSMNVSGPHVSKKS